MEHPSYQPYSGNQSYEFYSPIHQPDYSNHHPSYTQSYPDQPCPDQPQYQPHPQQGFESTSEENHNSDSTAWETEEVTAFQPSVRSCTKSEAEMIMEMQHTYEEQQSHMDVMIRQVALLAEMIKEVKENRAKSEVEENAEIEKSVMRAEEREPAEGESEALSEGKETEETERDEEKSIITPPKNDVSEKILGEPRDKLYMNEEVIKCGENIDATSSYLQPDIVQAPEEKVEEFTILVKKKKSTPVEESPPLIDRLEGCSYEEEEPEWKEDERSRRNAARAIY